MKSRLLLASAVFLGITVSNSQTLRDYVGSYVVPREQRHNSPYLYQFDIIEDTARANVFYANVMFFSDTTVNSTDSALDCITRELLLIGDSLKFKTNDCFNERYEFIGKFIRKPRGLEEDVETPILKGTLRHFSGSRLLTKERVLFHWGGEC